MSDLLTSSEITEFKGAAEDLWDTFSPHHEIVVHKEPIKTISTSNIDTRNLYGYNQKQNETIVTYTHISGIFSARVMYNDQQNQETIDQLNIEKDEGKVKIMVDQAARDFILSGITEKIEHEGYAFNVITEDRVKNFLGFKRYVFHMERTK